MSWLNKISDGANKAAEYLVALLLAMMSVVVFVQVIGRWTRLSLPWSEEFARYAMIYMVYIGTSVGVKYGNHIAVEFIVNLLPKKGQKIMEVIVCLLMIVCFAIICRYGLKLVGVTMMQKSPAMQIKMGYVYFALVLGGVLMLLHSINEIVNVLTGYEPENHEEVAA